VQAAQKAGVAGDHALSAFGVDRDRLEPGAFLVGDPILAWALPERQTVTGLLSRRGR
jgi:hypothetical protein